MLSKIHSRTKKRIRERVKIPYLVGPWYGQANGAADQESKTSPPRRSDLWSFQSKSYNSHQSVKIRIYGVVRRRGLFISRGHVRLIGQCTRVSILSIIMGEVYSWDLHMFQMCIHCLSQLDVRSHRSILCSLEPSMSCSNRIATRSVVYLCSRVALTKTGRC
jgi:hypothetical protein